VITIKAFVDNANAIRGVETVTGYQLIAGCGLEGAGGLYSLTDGGGGGDCRQRKIENKNSQ